jgi:uncharacterized protein DUF5343
MGSTLLVAGSTLLAMTLPTAYLTSTKNLAGILDAVQNAQAPPRFTQKFLEGLGYSSNSDRLVINVLKALGFLSDTGEPLQRYHEYLDKSQGKRVLAEGIRQAYSDLFQVNSNAQTMSRTDIKNKMKTLSQGQHGDSVLDKMAMTFKALGDRADFSVASGAKVTPLKPIQPEIPAGNGEGRAEQSQGVTFAGLSYDIHIHLPESRDPAVYDALFKSLREHMR